MKLLKILSIMLLATTWTILFAYVLRSDSLYSVMGVSVAACYVFLAFYQKKGNHGNHKHE